MFECTSRPLNVTLVSDFEGKNGGGVGVVVKLTAGQSTNSQGRDDDVEDTWLAVGDPSE